MTEDKDIINEPKEQEMKIPAENKNSAEATENKNPAEEDNKQQQIRQETETVKSEECREKDKLLRDWEKEYNELYDKYLRIYSEFENFRRRTAREKIELIDHANANLILDILPVADDFERALEVMKTTEDVKSVKEGISLIYNKFRKVLEDSGLKEIDCIGKEFNPDLHEAITKIPAPKKKLKDHIVDQILKGYYLKDKVIRHSKVVIGE